MLRKISNMKKIVYILIASISLLGCKVRNDNHRHATNSQKEADTHFELGKKYYNGDGVTIDYGKAVACFQKAANQGHAQAQRNLASCYEEGKGVPPNIKKAIEWCQKAADQGDEVTLKQLDVLLNVNK